MNIAAASAQADIRPVMPSNRRAPAADTASPALDPNLAAPTTSAGPVDPNTDPRPPVADPVPDPNNADPARARGVLRNLASGHFRGVAELRLRENFAGEIEAAGIKLPEPTPANGRGRAYERLMARYQASLTPAPLNPVSEPPIALDAVA